MACRDGGVCGLEGGEVICCLLLMCSMGSTCAVELTGGVGSVAAAAMFFEDPKTRLKKPGLVGADVATDCE